VTSIPAATGALNIGAGGTATTFTGTVTLGTDNTAFLGQVFINGGAVRISNGNALGSNSDGTITTQLSSGGTGQGALELMGGITVNKNVVTRARQGGTANNVMLRNISGSNTINNVFTNTGGNTFTYESLAGNLTISNWNTTATGGERFLNLQGETATARSATGRPMPATSFT
jgi:hypothetical protein